MSARLRFLLVVTEDGVGEVYRVPIEPDEQTKNEILRALSTRRRVRTTQLERFARNFIAENPEASATAFYRLAGGRKQDAWDAFRAAQTERDGSSTGSALPSPESRVPASRNARRITTGDTSDGEQAA